MTAAEQSATKSGTVTTSDRRAVVADLALAATGLVISLARVWHPEAGWSYGEPLLVFVVALAPALIVLRRVAPIPVAVALMGAALVALVLGQFDWVLIAGCAVALWSVAALRIWLSAAGVVVVVAGLPLLAWWRWDALVQKAFNRIAAIGDVEYRGELMPGITRGITPEDVGASSTRAGPGGCQPLLPQFG